MRKIINFSISVFIGSLLFGTSSVYGQVKTRSTSIKGCWEIIDQKFTSGDSIKTSIPYRSVIIFTGKFYSITFASVDRPSWPTMAEGEKASYENLENAYQHFTSNAGRYEIKGDSIIYSITVAKSPNYMNDVKYLHQAFSLNGDKLITYSTSASGGKLTTAYKRLE